MRTNRLLRAFARLALAALLAACGGGAPTRPAVSLPEDPHPPRRGLYVDAAGVGDATQFLDRCVADGVTDLLVEVAPGEPPSPLLAAAPKRGIEAIPVVFLFSATPAEVASQGLAASLSKRFDPESALALPSEEAGATSGTLALSPASAAARAFALRRLRTALGYGARTVCIGDCRFASPGSDISATARDAFELWLGRTVRRWPDDVLAALAQDEPTPRGLPAAWTLWRAQVLRRFLFDARGVMAESPGTKLWALVDGYYPLHYRDGLNWASEDVAVEALYPNLPAGYHETGTAHLLDGLVLSMPAPVATARDAQAAGFAPWASIAGARESAARVLGGEVRPAILLFPSLFAGADGELSPAEKEARDRALDAAQGAGEVFLVPASSPGVPPG